MTPTGNFTDCFPHTTCRKKTEKQFKAYFSVAANTTLDASLRSCHSYLTFLFDMIKNDYSQMKTKLCLESCALLLYCTLMSSVGSFRLVILFTYRIEMSFITLCFPCWERPPPLPRGYLYKLTVRVTVTLIYK